jgi:3-oxoacyl-[acyl-carrier-protein] synthase-3
MSNMMSSTFVSQLDGLGHYVPSNRIDNRQLENLFHLESGWIEARTGIKARRWVREGELLIDLAEKAGIAAIKNASILRQDIGLTILATSTPDQLLPPTAPLLAHRLGLSFSCAYDLSGACSGFLNALVMADGFVRTQKKAALIVAANILSRRIDLSEYNTAILFGDAAGAMIIKPSTDQTKGILGVSFLSDGSAYDLISISAGGNKRPFTSEIPLCDYKMKLHDGPAIFAQAVKMMTQCAHQAMMSAHLSSADIQHFIPHQANLRISENTAKKLGISSEKIISIIDEYGNSSAAGIPLALSMTHKTKPFFSGEKILLTTAGAGMTATAIVFGV